MITYLAPDYGYTDHDAHAITKIFLGGSIEMGAAVKWQDALTEFLSSYEDDVIVLNPRRDDWDASWIQDPTPGTQFHDQVTWELDAQEDSDIHVYYFDPKTKSPITLFELGTFGIISPETTIVCCPPDFYRYGNVKIFCDRHDIKLVHIYEELEEVLAYWLEQIEEE